MTRLYLIIAVIAYSYCAESQTTFNHRFRFDYLASVLTSVVPTDSCYYATGIVADTVFPYNTGSVFVKFNLEGQPVLVKTLTSPEKTYETWFNDLLPLPNGDFVLLGYTFDSLMKAILIKYTPEGDTVFMREFQNPVNKFAFIQPRGGLVRTIDGGMLISSWITDNPAPFNSDIYIIKTDSLGYKEWGKTYGNPFLRDRPQSLVITSEGKTIIGSAQSNENMTTENYTYRCHIFQVDSLGNVEWDYLSPPGTTLRDAANDMVLLEDGSLVVASGVGHEQERTSVNVVYFDKYIFKLNPQHQLEWELTFPDSAITGWARTTKLIKLNDDAGYILGGITYNTQPPPKYFTIRGWLAKVCSEGDSLWSRRFAYLTDGENEHELNDMKETSDGGIILCGESRDWGSDAEYPQQAWLLKLDSYGCLVPGCQLTDAAEEAGAEPALQLAIYPNPAADYLNFYLRGPVQGREPSFRIVSAAGQVVRTFPGSGPGMTYIVPVWDWAPGVYFLQYVEEGVVRASERFVKR